MSYTNPEDVTSPQDHLSSVDVIYDGGDGPFSEGNPHSRGFPTWFVHPDEIAEIVKRSVLPK